ncbi:hypothetical protein FIBSPDRAFT_1042495 [Athelia psychrophila]|uniref:Uncharacterized protein n=1 Tax=Athelia psychrophila TaxID=1759441 RepID=A0A166MF08_9AGAM|nr:hypothetical protein FIBSPDRAFT_1042495 [Fibularhizoctonia sp. CBS 109695]
MTPPHASSSKVPLDYPSHTCPGDYLDQIASLLRIAEELEDHIQIFMDDHRAKMGVFRTLKGPLAALEHCHISVKDTIQNFHRAVGTLQPQITEISDIDDNYFPELPVSCQVNGVTVVPPIEVAPTSNLNANFSTPFTVKVSNHGLDLDLPASLTFRPNGLLRARGAVPDGGKWEVKSDGVAQSRLSPISPMPAFLPNSIEALLDGRMPAGMKMHTEPDERGHINIAPSQHPQHPHYSMMSPMPVHPPKYQRYVSPHNPYIAVWRESACGTPESATIRIPRGAVENYNKKKREREEGEEFEVGGDSHSVEGDGNSSRGCKRRRIAVEDQSEVPSVTLRRSLRLNAVPSNSNSTLSAGGKNKAIKSKKNAK